MLTVVVARYQEDVAWTSLLSCNVVVVNASQIYPNGRESGAYLAFLTQYYHGLRGDYVFCQGNPFDHCPDFVNVLDQQGAYGARYRCDKRGRPHWDSEALERLAQCLELPPLPESWLFTTGAQVRVSEHELRSRSLEFYQRALAVNRSMTEAPWAYERLWDLIFYGRLET